MSPVFLAYSLAAGSLIAAAAFVVLVYAIGYVP